MLFRTQVKTFEIRVFFPYARIGLHFLGPHISMAQQRSQMALQESPLTSYPSDIVDFGIIPFFDVADWQEFKMVNQQSHAEIERHASRVANADNWENCLSPKYLHDLRVPCIRQARDLKSLVLMLNHWVTQFTSPITNQYLESGRDDGIWYAKSGDANLPWHARFDGEPTQIRHYSITVQQEPKAGFDIYVPVSKNVTFLTRKNEVTILSRSGIQSEQFVQCIEKIPLVLAFQNQTCVRSTADVKQVMTDKLKDVPENQLEQGTMEHLLELERQRYGWPQVEQWVNAHPEQNVSALVMDDFMGYRILCQRDQNGKFQLPLKAQNEKACRQRWQRLSSNEKIVFDFIVATLPFGEVSFYNDSNLYLRARSDNNVNRMFYCVSNDQTIDWDSCFTLCAALQIPPRFPRSLPPVNLEMDFD